MALVTLTGDYQYSEYWIRSASDTTFNAATADFQIAARESVPAINIFDSRNIVINGGEIWGEVSQTASWDDIYNHMATGFRISNSPNTTIRNVQIDGTWDGIRFIPDDSLKVANGNSNGWLIEDVYMSNIRDDAIENDFAATGTLRDSFLDGVFSAFGTVNDQSAHGVLTVDDSIIVMKDYLKDGELVHGSPFKFNTKNPENNPELRIFDSIIAVQDPSHNGISRLKEAWANLTESSSNYYLNLSDTPFNSKYPLPPKGFTILQGQEARDFLQIEEDKWLAEHIAAGGTDLDPTPDTITIANPPVAGNDTAVTDEDTDLVLDWATLLANDSDADGDALSITAVVTAAHGSVVLDATARTLTYTPGANYNGPDSFTYTVSDGAGGTAMAPVDITVNSVNDAPSGTDKSVAIGSSGNYSFTAADFGFSDIDGDAFSAVKITTLPAAGSLTLADLAVGEGQLIAAGEIDQLIYTSGDSPSSFTFQVQDGGGGTDLDPTPNTISITAPAPVSKTVTFRQGVDGYFGTVDTKLEAAAPTTSYGSAKTLATDLLNFNDGGEEQTLLRFDGLFGSAAGQIPLNAVITSATLTLTTSNDSADGARLYRLNTDWTENSTWSSLDNGISGSEVNSSYDVDTGPISPGTGGLDVTISLQAWLSDPTSNHGWLLKALGNDGWSFRSSEYATSSRPMLSVTYSVPSSGGNNPPVAGNDTAVTAEDTDLVLDWATLLANDSDADGDALTIASVGDATSGTVEIIDGQVRYAPDAGFVGSDAFSYVISDGAGGTAQASVAVTVEAADEVNDPPVAVADSASTSEGTPVKIYGTNLEDGPGAKPNAAGHFLVYDSNTGYLFYEVDGSGDFAAPIAFAELQAGLDLITGNFWVI